MPILDAEHVQNLLLLGAVHSYCRECGHHTAMDYCRTCDEFFWHHAPGCAMYTAEHDGHRLTIVPFVEDRCLGM